MTCLLNHRQRRDWCPYCPTFFTAALAALRKFLGGK